MLTIEYLQHLKEILTYPCLVFGVFHNQTYGKTFTISDMKRPSIDVYHAYVSDMWTVGRSPIMSYDDWSNTYMEYELKSLQNQSSCKLCIQKVAVSSFDDVCQLPKLEGFVRFFEADGS